MSTLIRISLACFLLLSFGACRDAGQTSNDMDLSAANLLPARSNHTAVWTGTELILYGGVAKGVVSSQPGGLYAADYSTPNAVFAYEPGSDSWTLIREEATTRAGHSAIWTGTEMIVWGGITTSPIGSATAINTGTRYDPATGLWSSVSTTNAPSPRGLHTALRANPVSAPSGTAVMIVWGGTNATGSQVYNDGGRYDPVSDVWTSLSATNAPAERMGYSAVWTGKEMIVWGGITYNASGGVTYYNNGGRYDPAADTWTPVSTLGAPTARQGHIAVWTGTEMLLFGGFDQPSNGLLLMNGGRYDPATDTWSPLLHNSSWPYYETWGDTLRGAWTGTELIVLSSSFQGRYNPSSQTWNDSGPYFSRSASTAAWTGTELILWGGRDLNGACYNTGIRYNPSTNTTTRTAVLYH